MNEQLSRLQEQAEGGDANAQYELGMAYQCGSGVPQSFTEAIKWYKKAAAQGDERASRLLWFLDMQGIH